jgi:phosphate starvation-inducible PhoH-like protein
LSRKRRLLEAAQENKKKETKFRDQVVVTAKTDGQKRYIVEIKNNDIIFCYGPAGTGKTAVAVGLGLQAILAPNPAFEKIVVLRPAREACDEKIGFLPGQLEDKMSPWAAPVIDNVSVFVEQSRLKNLLYEHKIEVVPIGFSRGRSFNKSYVILDEAQNTTPKQMLLVLTRLGQDSKLIINGDTDQSDMQNGDNGLSDAIKRLEGLQGLSIVKLDETDIVRHRLIGEIIRRYKQK